MTSAAGRREHAPIVRIVVVNWNGRAVLKECLESLFQLTYPIEEVIVVDNGSEDGSVEMMERDYAGRVSIIRNAENRGAPPARNQGMYHAVAQDTDFVFCIDNDLTIAPDAITILLGVLDRDPRIIMAGALIMYQDRPNVIFSAGQVINWTQNLVTSLGQNQEMRGQFRDIWDVDYVGSGAAMIRVPYIRKHGGFDESYIGYGYEDTEYGYRAKKLGYRVVCCADARVWHRPFSTVGHYSFRKKYLESRNAVRFIKRYGTFGNWCKYLFYLFGGFAYALIRETPRGNLPGVIGKMRGFVDGLRNYDGTALRLLGRTPRREP